MKKELLIIRHGMTAPNIEGRAVGVTDRELLDEGIEEVVQLGRSLKAEGSYPQVIFSGPLKRQKETANILKEFFGSDIHVRSGLREANYGDYEGASLETLRNIQYGYDAGSMRQAGGETPLEIERRVAPVIYEMLTSNEERIAAVTSALTASIMVQILKGEERVLSTAKPLKTGDFHHITMDKDPVGEFVVVSFEQNRLKQPLRI
jgi:broad specificity phosphatase PhoE